MGVGRMRQVLTRATTPFSGGPASALPGVDRLLVGETARAAAVPLAVTLRIVCRAWQVLAPQGSIRGRRGAASLAVQVAADVVLLACARVLPWPVRVVGEGLTVVDVGLRSASDREAQQVCAVGPSALAFEAGFTSDRRALSVLLVDAVALLGVRSWRGDPLRLRQVLWQAFIAAPGAAIRREEARRLAQELPEDALYRQARANEEQRHAEREALVGVQHPPAEDLEQALRLLDTAQVLIAGVEPAAPLSRDVTAWKVLARSRSTFVGFGEQLRVDRVELRTPVDAAREIEWRLGGAYLQDWTRVTVEVDGVQLVSAGAVDRIAEWLAGVEGGDRGADEARVEITNGPAGSRARISCGDIRSVLVVPRPGELRARWKFDPMAASLLGAAATVAVPDNIGGDYGRHVRAVACPVAGLALAGAVVLHRQQTPRPVPAGLGVVAGSLATGVALHRLGPACLEPGLAGSTRGRFAVYGSAHLLGAAWSRSGSRTRTLTAAILAAQVAWLYRAGGRREVAAVTADLLWAAVAAVPAVRSEQLAEQVLDRYDQARQASAQRDYAQAAERGVRRVAAWLLDQCDQTERTAAAARSEGWLPADYHARVGQLLAECRQKVMSWPAMATLDAP